MRRGRVFTLLLLAISQRILRADLYGDLGIDRGASADEVKKAFRRLAVTLHPDKNPHPDAAAQFAKVNAAYEVLSDASKRQVDISRDRRNMALNY